MSTQGSPSTGRCPECGAHLSRWPTLEGEGYLDSCETCGFSAARDHPAAEPPGPNEQAPSRFRELLTAHEQTPPTDLPDELLAVLPESAREALLPDPQPRTEESDPLSNDLEQQLKEHGYSLSTDGHGPRLSAGMHRSGSGDLSAYDLVRLAAEMEGGVPGPDQKIQCPKCRAVITVGEQRCPWCDHDLDWDQDFP